MKMYTGVNISEVMLDDDDMVRVKRQEETLKSNLPTSLNWVQRGYVTKAKKQSSCQSCWTFSAVSFYLHCRHLHYCHLQVLFHTISLDF